MRKKRLIILLGSIVFLVAFLVLQTFGITGTGVRVKFQTINQGYGLVHTTQAYYVIQDFESWISIYGEYPPYIDFSNTTVIAVYMGQFNTGGYSIEIREIIDTGFTLVVKVQKTYPGAGCGLIQVITYPRHIVSIDKINKPIIFQTSTITSHCR